MFIIKNLKVIGDENVPIKKLGGSLVGVMVLIKLNTIKT